MPFLKGLLLEKMNGNQIKLFKKPSIQKNIKRRGLLYLKLYLGVSMSRITLLEGLSELVTVSQ